MTPLGLILIGVGIFVIGIALVFLLMKKVFRMIDSDKDFGSSFALTIVIILVSATGGTCVVVGLIWAAIDYISAKLLA